MSGYWIDDPDNPFNRMSYTRGGGGHDNKETRESNERRESAMMGAGASALPHFATTGVARKLNPKGMSVVGDNVIAFVKQPHTTGPGAASAKTEGGSGGSGAGASGVVTAPRGGGSGAGSKLVLSGPLKPVLNDEITQFQVGGITMHPDQFTSNMQDIEDRWGDAEFLSPAWFASWGVAGMDVVSNVNRYRDEFGQSMMRGIDAGITHLRTLDTSSPRQVRTPSDSGGYGLGAFSPMPTVSSW